MELSKKTLAIFEDFKIRRHYDEKETGTKVINGGNFLQVKKNRLLK
jgi:hypothetical protein